MNMTYLKILQTKRLESNLVVLQQNNNKKRLSFYIDICVCIYSQGRPGREGKPGPKGDPVRISIIFS